MGVLVKGLGELLNLLVQAFNLSFTLPALVFGLLVQLFVVPLCPELSWMNETEDPVKLGLAIVLIVLVAHLLNANNYHLIRFFEGRLFQDQYPFSHFRRENMRHVAAMQSAMDELNDEFGQLAVQIAQELKREPPDPKKIPELNDVLAKKKQIRENIANIVQAYPERSERVLATSFGNVIAAAEEYPRSLFGIDAVTLWPFIAPILTEKHYAEFVQREKSLMDLMLNLCIVLLVFGILLGFAELRAYGIQLVLFVKLAGIAVTAFLFALMAVPCAESWGWTIRVAYTLYKEDLRASLQLPKGSTYDKDYRIWRHASTFYRRQRDLSHQVFDKYAAFLFDSGHIIQQGGDDGKETT